MDFILREDQKMMRKLFREFAENEIKPQAASLDEEGEFPTENLKKMAQQGFMGIPVPEKWEGGGADFLTYILAIEEFSRVCASTGVILAVHTSLGTFALLNFGTQKQKEKYIYKLATGKFLGAYALTESEAGSDAASLQTTATLKGEEYLLNGSKIFITSGGEADIYIVFATIDREKGAAGVTAFVVDKDTPGLIIGTKEKKMGLHASSTTELTFADCRVPLQNRVGEEGQGFSIAMSLLDGGRIGIAAQALGIAQAAFETAVEYAKTREQFGRSISQFQAISFKLADMATSIEAARLLLYQAADLKERGKPCSKEASMAKVLATDTAMQVTTAAVQVLGGYGYSREYPVERFMREAKVTQIYEGTNQIQRLVIGKHILG